MQRETNRFVIGRENNVVRVDFSRDPDPPAPRFPGANGLREINDDNISTNDEYLRSRPTRNSNASFAG
jgi:hypothetical protein